MLLDAAKGMGKMLQQGPLPGWLLLRVVPLLWSSHHQPVSNGLTQALRAATSSPGSTFIFGQSFNIYSSQKLQCIIMHGIGFSTAVSVVLFRRWRLLCGDRSWPGAAWT